MQMKERTTDRHIVQLGKARRHTRAIDNQPNPELVGGRTQFTGG